MAAVLCTVARDHLDTWPEITEAAAVGSRGTFPQSCINTSCLVGENCKGVRLGEESCQETLTE